MQRISRISDLLSLILLFVILGGSFYYVYDNRPCAKPIIYSIGTFDPKFGISESQFIADSQEAIDLWNKEVGHTVLAYSPSGKMSVNLIYDTRQKLTDTGKSISSEQRTLDTQKSSIQLMQQQYNTQKQQIQSEEAVHGDVTKINSEIDSLNKLATQIQTNTESLNIQISQVNAQARNFNTNTGHDFQEGEFIDEAGVMRINIYEFMNHTQLVRVLAHEFGHSLGLGHIANVDSIMYPENTSISLTLSPEDKSAIATRCTFSWKNLNPFAAASQSSE